MYTINRVTNSTAAKYEKLTFPIFRHALHKLELESYQSVITVGASLLGEPTGLALGQIEPDSSSAEVLSLFVSPSHRCGGLGTALLISLEEELTQKGCTKVELIYTSGKPTTPALGRLLQKCNWSSPKSRMLLCKGETHKIIKAPWINKYSRLPASYSIVPWLEITQEERAAIQQQQDAQPWIPEDLVPFKYDQNFEPLTSLALRYQGQVVGWTINHRFDADTIRYTCSFVRKDLQKMGRIISLYAEACKRQFEANIPKGIWTVPFAHASMVEFVKRRWTPYLTSVAETRGSFKILQEQSSSQLDLNATSHQH